MLLEPVAMMVGVGSVSVADVVTLIVSVAGSSRESDKVPRIETDRVSALVDDKVSVKVASLVSVVVCDCVGCDRVDDMVS